MKKFILLVAVISISVGAMSQKGKVTSALSLIDQGQLDKAKEAEKFSPRPLYLYESTSYISAFTNKPLFLEDQVNLNIMGYDWESRREQILWFVLNLDKEAGKDFLNRNNM